jgi:hypothetical protein
MTKVTLTTIKESRVLFEMKESLDRLIEMVHGVQSDVPVECVNEWVTNKATILKAVYDNGGVVTIDEWRSILADNNRDTRGGGGFYVGANASMIKLGGDKRGLSETGVTFVKKYYNL